jgi:hypothetical protein
MTAAKKGLWGIAAYFNPLRSRRRLANYQAFRRHLTVPLLTVELSFGAEFELSRNSAEILIQVREGDILWQKERLLNLALDALPPECSTVAWLDTDVIFERADWAQETSRLLDVEALVMPFENVYELGPDDRAPRRAGAYRSGRSLPALIEAGTSARELLGGNMRLDYACHSGLAWAARRDLLQQTRFYDVCILGSGNRAMVCAALGYFRQAQDFLVMNSVQQEHYLAWAQPYFHRVRGHVGCLTGGIFHLWHGRLEDRRYGARHRGLERFDVDPWRDIAVAPSGAWRWNSNKPALHRYIADYFASRNEDEESTG